MGGIPVLLALAVVGVDYGYQPAGDGKIDYIVQVSPEHWEQARDAGEITSVIDPSVRGRVHRIIIRIGDGELPRDSGPPAPAPSDPPDSAISPAHALSPLPSPTETVAEVRIATADDDFVPTPDLLADSGQAANALAARAMRPDPQTGQEGGGGFSLPGQQEGGGASEDPLRRLAGGTNAENADQPRPLGDSDGRVQQPSTDPRPAPNGRAAEPARPGTQPRSTTVGRDDSDWTENPSPGRGTSTPSPRNNTPPSSGGSGTATGDEPASTTPAYGFGAQPVASEPNSSGGGYRAPNGYGQTDGYGQPNPGSNDPSQAYGSATEGAAPARQTPPGHQQGSSGTQAYGYANTPASLQDHRLAGYDRYGRPVNAAGQLIPPPSLASPEASGPVRGYESPSYRQSPPERYAMGGADTAGQPRTQAGAGQETSEPPHVPRYGRDRDSAATHAEPVSPSDADESRKKAEREIAAELAAARAALNAHSDEAENQSLVTQPVFNFLLLVSLVANAYLILTMSKLLQRYRNMVANMRSASTPAA